MPPPKRESATRRGFLAAMAAVSAGADAFAQSAQGTSAAARSAAAPGEPLDSAARASIYWNEVDRGGHFAAWEQPQLFSKEIRAAFRSLR
jgi:hypothetical protein